MKKVTSLALTVLLAASLFMACSSSGSESDTLPTAPPADAANDDTSLGVYKGVIADTSVSGSFWVEVGESAPVISVMSSRAPIVVLIPIPTPTSAELNILVNGVYRQVEGTITGSGPYTVSFSGFSIDGKTVTLSFDLGADGTVSNADLLIDASLAQIALYKETSTEEVSSWEGTFSGSNGDGGTMSGIWNSTCAGSDMMIVYSGSSGGSPMSDQCSAVKSGASVTVTLGFPGAPSASGTISGTNFTGNWNWPGEAAKGTGTWSGVKTQ